MPAGASEDFLFCAVEIDSLLLLLLLLMPLPVKEFGHRRRCLHAAHLTKRKNTAVQNSVSYNACPQIRGARKARPPLTR